MWELKEKSVWSHRKFTGTRVPAPSQQKHEIKEERISAIAEDKSLIIQGIPVSITPFVIQ